jgi:hypothetical protein
VSDDQWRTVANEFNVLWNFPKYVGVMDGKHITTQAPYHNDNDFFNYKSFFSVVLFVVANADYQVRYMNVDCQGAHIRRRGVCKYAFQEDVDDIQT